MDKNEDKKLIEEFIEWCIKRDFNQNKIAFIVRRTKGWASMLVNGQIHHLQFDTRNRIKQLLGKT